MKNNRITKKNRSKKASPQSIEPNELAAVAGGLGYGTYSSTPHTSPPPAPPPTSRVAPIAPAPPSGGNMNRVAPIAPAPPSGGTVNRVAPIAPAPPSGRGTATFPRS